MLSASLTCVSKLQTLLDPVKARVLPASPLGRQFPEVLLFRQENSSMKNFQYSLLWTSLIQYAIECSWYADLKKLNLGGQNFCEYYFGQVFSKFYLRLSMAPLELITHLELLRILRGSDMSGAFIPP